MVYNDFMRIKTIPGVSAFLSRPEIQFLLLVFLPLLVTFAFFYELFNRSEQLSVLFVFLSVLAILILQAVHAAHARKLLIKKEREFLSVCIHQMRDPLSAIRFAVEEILSVDKPSSEKEIVAKGLISLNDRIEKIFDSFASATFLEGGIYGENLRHIDICEEIERAVEEAEPIARQYGVSVSAEGPCEELWVQVDPTEIDIVLSNLINNAIKYNHRGGSVTVSARPICSGGEVEVQVKDSGVGIPADEHGKIFQRSFRGRQTRSSSRLGFGLGLYLAKEIVSRHGGRIWVDSAPGKGSTFHFSLPVGR